MRLPFFVLALSVVAGAAFNCTRYSEQIGVSPSFSTLGPMAHTYCLLDEDCRDLYSQRKHANYSIFSFLSRRIIDADDPVELFFCSGAESQTDEQLAGRLWALWLNAGIKNEALCDINHHPVIDGATMTIRCECDPEKECGPSGPEITAVFILAIVLAILFIMLLLTQIAVYGTLVRGARSLFQSFLHTGRDGAAIKSAQRSFIKTTL